MNRRKMIKAGLALGLVSALPTPEIALAKQRATPSAGETQPELTGILANNIQALPTAAVGEVEIVLQSAPLGKYTGFLIHNNIGVSVGFKHVRGIARDTDGALAGVLDSDRAAPYRISPGQYCLGFATFDKELGPDITVELTPEFEIIGSALVGHVDLDVTEVLATNRKVIGVVENRTSSSESVLSHVVGLFLDERGEIVGAASTFLDRGVDAGEFFTFNTRLSGGRITDKYLFASSGREG